MRHLLLLLCFVSTASAQDLSKTVVPITKLQILGPGATAKFGTGFCIDPECRFIGTNYHVAKAMGKHFTVEGNRVISRWLATGPDDEEATSNRSAGLLGKILPKEKYALVRDLAIVELRRSLSEKGYHGIPFYNEDLIEGQEVTIYSFPLHLNPKRDLESFKAKFIGYNGLGDQTDKPLLFSYDPADGKVTGGASGGIVVDAQGRIVGILNAIALNADHTVTAVPIQVFAAFLGQVQPHLSAELFPKSVLIAPASPDNYPEWIPPHRDPLADLEVDCGHLDADGKCLHNLPHRPVEAPEIVALRVKATSIADSMKNYIAIQSFEWGKGDRKNTPQAIADFEVRIIDGYEKFREYPDGKKLYEDVPFPAPLNTAINPAGEWAETADLVGNNLKLRINHAPDITVNGETYQVFQWVGAVEDGICRFKTIKDFGFMTWSKVDTLACYGEVWTDKDLNIVRASENYKLIGTWKNFHGVVTFGMVKINGHEVHVPLTISIQADDGGKLYWCRGQFTDYHEFSSTVRIGVGTPTN